MNNILPSGWRRIEYNDIPLYIKPDGPDWFVPNEVADMELLSNRKASPKTADLVKRLGELPAKEYGPRSKCLKLNGLKECWLHITNRCNMECGHCMFKSSPFTCDELSADECGQIIDESYHLGCRLYYFTGGEPFLAKGFIKSITDIFRLPDTHVVVLSNLSLLSTLSDQLGDFPKDRLHFQVSLDGLKKNHDTLRGRGAFQRLTGNLSTLHKLGFPVTLSTTVTRNNFEEMEGVVDFAARHQVSNIHFLWLFKKGNADEDLFVEPALIFPRLTAAQELAEKTGIKIDNIEILYSQVFSCPGTRYDLSNAGWESITVGPDGSVYPTPALVYTEDMKCGHISQGLKNVWETSPVLNSMRNASLNDSDTYRANPFRYIIGGGDIDHSYINSGKLTGGDPYTDLYNSVVKWIIAREAGHYKRHWGYPAMLLKMGEKLGDCPVHGGDIFLTHSNCVLSLPGHDIHTQVNRFYTIAAEKDMEDIRNPICYEEDLIRHIPEEMRYRSYGCGSPVMEAGAQPGETVVDLGSGTGIECFMASRQVGAQGRVFGIDMGDAMLSLAEKAKEKVAKNLGYDNVKFKKAFLEKLPLADESANLVISNCVLNLSPDKRMVFSEVFRILKPGGRIVISDITYDAEIPLEIKYNETLRGECIGGALRYLDLFGLLNDIGFSEGSILKGYLYRTVKGCDFYSITYQAFKPADNEAPVLYNFPNFFQTMAEVKSEPTCACFISPETIENNVVQPEDPHKGGCMVCSADLVYLETNRDTRCHYCGRILPANAMCTMGHFVCDKCHGADAVEIVRQVCLNNREAEATVLMQAIRSHSRFRIHGPEHHFMVPAVILAALRNSGNSVSDEQIMTAIQRGQTIAGGACAFLGACGAAIGVGIAVSVLSGANPYDGKLRQKVQQATLSILDDIASYDAPRCCQRDSWLALQGAAQILKEMNMTLKLGNKITCSQYKENKECIHDACPLWPE